MAANHQTMKWNPPQAERHQVMEQRHAAHHQMLGQTRTGRVVEQGEQWPPHSSRLAEQRAHDAALRGDIPGCARRRGHGHHHRHGQQR